MVNSPNFIMTRHTLSSYSLPTPSMGATTTATPIVHPRRRSRRRSSIPSSTTGILMRRRTRLGSSVPTSLPTAESTTTVDGRRTG